MKFRITMIDPDGEEAGVENAAIDSMQDLTSDEEYADLIDEIQKFVSKWIGGLGMITIEFDTEKGTATLLKLEESDE